MRHVFLLRHGQTDANAAGIIQGYLPTRLNLVGVWQVAQLADRFLHLAPRVERIVSSDLDRALQSALPLARALQVGIEVDPGWRERHYGRLQGRSIEERQRPEWALPDEVIGWETSSAFHDRVLAAMLLVGARADVRSTAIITHGSVIRAVLRLMQQRLLFCGGSAPPLRSIANASITHLALEGGVWHLLTLSDIEHLRPLGIAPSTPSPHAKSKRVNDA